jgi:hypothetical protein
MTVLIPPLRNVRFATIAIAVHIIAIASAAEEEASPS